VTEIVKVVSVTDGTDIVVIRGNAPGPAGCVPNTAAAIGDDGIVHVVKPAGLSASGSCATKLDTTNGVAKVKAPGMLAAGNGGQSATFTFDSLNPAESTTARRAFRVGGYIMIGNEVMAVTGVTKNSATEGVLSVVRGVDLPCLKSEAGTTAHAAAAVIYEVVWDGCFVLPAATATADLKTTLTTTATTVHIDQAYNRAHVGGYLFINNEYMLITDIDVRTGTELDVTVTRNSAPPCVLGATVTSTALAADKAAANNIVKILTLPGSDNVISTSMRAIVELSPREPIVWAPVAPALPPSAFYVDVKVGIEYSEAEFATKSAAFTRAMSALTGVAVESTTVSYSAARRASGNVNARSYVLSQAEVTALLKKLGADTDTCTCGSSCQAALLKAVNEKLVAEGLKEATSAEIVFPNDHCKPKKKSDDNLLLLLLLLLLIPLAAAVYWCCKQEPVAPMGKPMAPVYLPQPYPVLEMSPQPVMMAPMPVVEMSPQPVMMAPMPMVEMSPQPVMMAPMGMQPPMPAPAQPMQYGM